MLSDELKPRLKRLDYHMVTGRFGGTQLKVKAEPIRKLRKPIDPEIRKTIDAINESYLELKSALGRIKASRRTGRELNFVDLDLVERAVKRIIVLVEDILTRKVGD